jgi:hypothetical protein
VYCRISVGTHPECLSQPFLWHPVHLTSRRRWHRAGVLEQHDDRPAGCCSQAAFTLMLLLWRSRKSFSCCFFVCFCVFCESVELCACLELASSNVGSAKPQVADLLMLTCMLLLRCVIYMLLFVVLYMLHCAVDAAGVFQVRPHSFGA